MVPVEIPPALRLSAEPDRGLGFGFLLGYDYERKKKKLQQELQLDYKQYAAKRKDLKTEPRAQPQGLSLPIHEKISVQEKLREERKREYNLFLQEKAQTGRLRRGTPTAKPEQVPASDAVYIINTLKNTHSPPTVNTCTNTHTHSPPTTINTCTNTRPRTHTHSPPTINTLTNTRPRTNTHPPSRRDAATLTEDGEKDGESTRSRGRRRWRVLRPKKPLYLYSSEEEEEEEEAITELEVELEERRRKHRANRAPREIKEVKDPDVKDHNNNDWRWMSDLQKSDVMRTAAADSPSSISKKAQVVTGLLIGAADEQTTSQAKKEKYKQELLEQIAEQKRNKNLEKTLRAAATDPGKQPDHVQREHVSRRRDVRYKPREEESEYRGRSHHDPSAQVFNQEYHRDFSNLLGDVSNPRVPRVPPPLPPSFTDHHRTPHDAEYHYYGANDPLHPPHNYRTETEHSPPPERHPPLRPSRHTQSESRVTDQHHVSLLEVGEPPAEKSKLMRERAQNYQEALRLQIREREDQKRKEKEEKERYEAKIEAERMAFNPWGRSGAGAPIKDQKGNVVSDLKHMHRAQEDCRSPVSRDSGHTQSFLMEKGDASPPAEPRSPAKHRHSGLSDHPTPEKLHIQDRYKEELIQQMEEKKRKDKEAAERMKMEEEKDARRLVEEMAINQRRYEEEEERRLEEERPGLKRGCEEEEKSQQKQRETKTRVHEVQTPQEEAQKEAPRTYEIKPRGASPPIPAVQRRMKNMEESPVTSDRSVSASHFQPSASHFQPSASHFQPSAPHFQPSAETPPLEEGQQEVMRGLSALKSMLRNRQRHLELQLEKIERQEPLYVPSSGPRRRPRLEAFESASARDNMQNIRETNQWQHRDVYSGDSCEERVHHQRIAPRRRPHCEAEDQRETSLNLQSNGRRKNQQRHDVGDQSDEDQFSLHSVATEEWLRPTL